MPETRISDYVSFLRDLGASGTDYFLEGGQAVNFWAEYYSAKGAGDLLSPSPSPPKTVISGQATPQSITFSPKKWRAVDPGKLSS